MAAPPEQLFNYNLYTASDLMDKRLARPPKSLADTLAEELDGKLGGEHTQELPVAEKEEHLKAVYERIHKEQPTLSALCLSGGGVRSATFALGILQGLARCGLLDKFHYLSTVGGGGYIGSWLSAWIKNHPQGIAGVVAELKRRTDSAMDPEPRPIRHLREFCKYLTPKAGLTSVDFWTVVAAYFRDIFLNWLVLISWLAAAMMIPRLYVTAINLQPNWSTWPSAVMRWDVTLTILSVIAFVLIAVATAYTIIDVPSTGNARLPQRRFLEFYQLPMLLASLILAEWWALFRNVHGSEPFQASEWLPTFIAFSVASYFSGGVLATVILSGFRKPEQKARRGRLLASILRLNTTLLTAAFAGLCLWAIETRIFFVPAANALNYVCFAPGLILAVLLLVNILSTGLASRVTSDEDREWWGRSAAWSLITIGGWIVLNAIVLWGTHAMAATLGNDINSVLERLNQNPVAKAVLGAFGGITGIVAALLAVRSKVATKLGAKAAFQLPLFIAATVFFVLLSIIISWVLLLIGSYQPSAVNATARFLGQEVSTSGDQIWVAFFLASGPLLFGITLGFFINTNKFSLHAIYKNRLIRAYLAASRRVRRPHLFTGFDPDDNLSLHELSPEKPLHVINAALNLVRGEQLAWQERVAESFTMSRLHCGSPCLGYRPSTEYGNGISLGSAMAISGVAANPNQGYYSSPIVGLLMALFNGRVGCWLGNPGRPGDRTWRRNGPGYFLGPLLSEATGNTTDRYKYVNLFDGSHFENLGLYEMVLRRCHYIVVIDASEDPKCSFADLGEAVRKIRIHLGISIEFENIMIQARSDDEAKNSKGRYCAIGHIRYSAVDPDVNGKKAPDGVLIYIKPVWYGDGPPDLFEYATINRAFPHEPASDWSFTESQFESYRMLGDYTMEKICGKTVRDFCNFIQIVAKEHLMVPTRESAEK